MNIKLNKRLSSISAFINKEDKVIDIGCDHGLLGIYLYQKQKNRIISSDINELPLKKAYDNLVKYNLENEITLKLGNGLETIENDIDTVVISGMGGLTIIEILKDIKKYPNVKKLVISPNNDFLLTRKEISKLNFMIKNEEIVKENNKYYLISVYEFGKKKYSNYFGKLDLNNKEVIDYYSSIYYKNKSILKSIPKIYVIKKLKIKLENYLIAKKISIK